MTEQRNVHNLDDARERSRRIDNSGNDGGGNDMSYRLGVIEGKIEGLATKEGVQGVRTEIAESSKELQKTISNWLFRLLLAVLVVILGLVCQIVIQFLSSTPSLQIPSATPPIVTPHQHPK